MSEREKDISRRRGRPPSRTPATLVEKIYLYPGEELKEKTLPEAVQNALLEEIEQCETLTAKEKRAIKLRLSKGLTFRQIGEIMGGVTREAARRSEKRSIRKLARRLGNLSEDEIEAFRDILWDHGSVSSPLSVSSMGQSSKRRKQDS